MSKITLKDIQEQMAADHWVVLSETYQNLSTEMKFQCPEGHTVYSTWDKMRKKPECPVCKQNIFKENKSIILPKKKGVRRTLALDQASHITGWSIFDDKQLSKYGTYEAGAELSEAQRFHDIRLWLVSMLENWQVDYVAIEGIQYQQNFGVTTFQTLARLQGILMETCFERGISFSVVPTNTWRAHCGVKGVQRVDKKRSMQLLVKQWFDISVSDDESDAIGIGKYAAEVLGKKTEIESWE